MTVSIVAPAYREAQNLPELCERIAAAMEAAALAYEIVVVDDASDDGTETVARRLIDEGHPLRLLVRLEERGRTGAALHGLTRARGDILVCMNADLSHPPEKLIDLVRPLLAESGPDFVLARGVSTAGAESASSGGMLSSAAELLARPLAPGAIHDPMAEFFALPRTVLQRSASLGDSGYRVGLELLLKCGCTRIEEVPVERPDVGPEKTKHTVRGGARYLNHLSRLYDFRWPRTVSSAKFLVAVAIGWLAALGCYSALLTVLPAHTLASLLGAYLLGAVGVNALLFQRYMIYNHEQIVTAHPYREFVTLSVVEFAAVAAVASSQTRLPAAGGVETLTLLVAAGTLVRFLGRKIAGHDLRGPAILRAELERYTYSDDRLACHACRDHHFSFPFPLQHPWLLRCRNCHVMFAHPQPSDEELDGIYDESYFDEWGAHDGANSLRQMKERSFELLLGTARRVRPARSVLDIGCGLGHGIDAARRMGMAAYGTEFNEAAVAAINERHPGAAVLGGVADVSAGRFELITVLEVLEHVRDPIAFLAEIRPRLDEEGLLAITVPDAGSSRAKKLGHRWYHIHRAHLWYFDKVSLRQTLERAGYELVLLTTARKVFTPRYVLGILEVKSGSPAIRRTAELGLALVPGFFLDLQLPPIGEGILAIARVRDEADSGVKHYLRMGS